MGDNECLTQCLVGSVTLGERGQIVIPADARAMLGLKPGHKLIILKHPFNYGLMIFKIEDVQAFLDDISQKLKTAKDHDGDEAGS